MKFHPNRFNTMQLYRSLLILGCLLLGSAQLHAQALQLVPLAPDQAETQAVVTAVDSQKQEVEMGGRRYSYRLDTQVMLPDSGRFEPQFVHHDPQQLVGQRVAFEQDAAGRLVRIYILGQGQPR